MSCALIARLAFGNPLVGLRLRALRLRIQLFQDILRVGLLSSLSPIATVATVLGLTALVARFGDAAIAGYGIGARLEFLLIPMVFGIGTAMTSMVGANIGAGKIKRAEHIGWLGGWAAALLSGSIGLLLAMQPGLWLDIFTDSPMVYSTGAAYLVIVGPLFAFQGFGLANYFASQGAGRVGWPVVATLLRMVLALGGGVLALEFGASISGLFACIAISMFVYGTVTAVALRLGAWRP